MKNSLGRIGIWTMQLAFGDPKFIAESAAELDALGFGAIWIPGGITGDVLPKVSGLLANTRKTTIATGILNIWKNTPAEVGDWWKSDGQKNQDRIMLGLGVSHGPIIGETWGKPVEVMRTFIDGLDAAGVPKERLSIAALGPKMNELARDRTAGAHPYMVGVEHIKTARKILGDGPLLMAELGVVLETDYAIARPIMEEAMVHYARLPNYTNNWKRVGITDDDIAARSDRLLDMLFAWGDTNKIKQRVKQFQDSGADHVCLQVLQPKTPDLTKLRRDWRDLAAALL